MGEVESIGLLEKKHSRRTFIKGVIATGATVSSASYLFKGTSLLGAAAVQTSTERLITLTVNGQQRRVDVLPNETLAMTLRYKLNLTGTKLGCDRAECGACTVLLDGVNHYACSILTHQVRDREVTTVEGLENPDTGELSVVQEAVLEQGGFQCAFCAPGFIMSMTAMVSQNPSVTREQARHALSGNLCRCADYDKILTCAMRAAELARSV
ncbi:MAG TPA: (2Fe-2S)-binding protein [Longimicrobiales bacterium]|nr:(2Fe-2S)-binding protein [Longimicrobiales bacterium]